MTPIIDPINHIQCTSTVIFSTKMFGDNFPFRKSTYLNNGGTHTYVALDNIIWLSANPCIGMQFVQLL